MSLFFKIVAPENIHSALLQQVSAICTPALDGFLSPNWESLPPRLGRDLAARVIEDLGLDPDSDEFYTVFEDGIIFVVATDDDGEWSLTDDGRDNLSLDKAWSQVKLLHPVPPPSFELIAEITRWNATRWQESEKKARSYYPSDGDGYRSGSSNGFESETRVYTAWSDPTGYFPLQYRQPGLRDAENEGAIAWRNQHEDKARALAHSEILELVQQADKSRALPAAPKSAAPKSAAPKPVAPKPVEPKPIAPKPILNNPQSKLMDEIQRLEESIELRSRYSATNRLMAKGIEEDSARLADLRQELNQMETRK